MAISQIARALVRLHGDNEDALVEAIALETSLEANRFAERLAKSVEDVIAKLQEPVSWKQALVLEHHGIAKKTAKTYTVSAFDEAMELFDHSGCEEDVYDVATRKLKKGCPIRMEQIRKELEGANA